MAEGSDQILTTFQAMWKKTPTMLKRSVKNCKIMSSKKTLFQHVWLKNFTKNAYLSIYIFKFIEKQKHILSKQTFLQIFQAWKWNVHWTEKKFTNTRFEMKRFFHSFNMGNDSKTLPNVWWDLMKKTVILWQKRSHFLIFMILCRIPTYQMLW